VRITQVGGGEPIKDRDEGGVKGIRDRPGKSIFGSLDSGCIQQE